MNSALNCLFSLIDAFVAAEDDDDDDDEEIDSDATEEQESTDEEDTPDEDEEDEDEEEYIGGEFNEDVSPFFKKIFFTHSFCERDSWTLLIIEFALKLRLSTY